MAELAAGAVVAEELVSTTVYAGVGAYALSQPTLPLKATYNQIAAASDDETRRSLARSDHSATVADNKLYVFGGRTANGKLASSDIHCFNLSSAKENSDPDYSLLPAVASSEGNPTPRSRSHHAACRLNVCIAVFGGRDEDGNVIDEDSLIWLYNTSKTAWESLKAEEAEIAPTARASAQLFNFNNSLVLYGGEDAEGHSLKDVWHFDYALKIWKPFPSAPVSTTNAALVDGVLYLISASEAMSGELHSYDLKADAATETWHTHTFPANPFNPGPRPRTGAGLVPVSTGYGRHYLLYFLGARQDPTDASTTAPDETTDPTQWSDIWVLQLPSSAPQAKVTTSLTDMIKPAAIKDAIRSRLGYESGERVWAEVEVVPPGEALAGVGIVGDGKGVRSTEGKIHPGPRAFFGCDVLADGVSVVFWGGLNAKGETEGDGWIIRVG